MVMRLHLCGRLAIEGPDGHLDERDLPGRQGRLALAKLTLERRRPLSADQLVDAVWGERPPHHAASDLASVVSKLRSCLRRVERSDDDIITSGSGCYQLRLPRASSVDLEDARSAIDRAEGCRRRDDPDGAWPTATVATTIAARGVLPGETADWILDVQREVETIHRRGLECLAWVWTERGDGALAVSMAEQATAIDGLHEPAWLALVLAHLASGNRAAAVRAFERCRQTLADELAIEPGAQFQALWAGWGIEPTTEGSSSIHRLGRLM